jgi:putative ABC transport system permease protein
MSLLGISLKNILRRPLRSAAIFSGVAAMSGILFSISIIFISVNRSLELSGARLGADAVVVPAEREVTTREILLSGEPSAFYMKEDIERKIMSENGIEGSSSQLFIISAPLACCTEADTMLVGYAPETDFTLGPWLRERLKKTPSADEIIVGKNIDAEPEGRLRFYGKEFLIIGKLAPTGMKFIDNSIFIPMDGARKMIAESSEKALRTLTIGKDEVSAVFLKLSPSANPDEVAVRLEYKNPGIKVILAGDVIKAAKRSLLLPMRSVIFVTSIEWIASLFMIGVLYMLSIGERKREIGVMRALGAKRKDIMKIFLYEITGICLSAGLTGSALGLLFVSNFEGMIKMSLKMPFLMPSTQEMMIVGSASVGFSLLTGLLAAIAPALKESGRQPYDSAREG